MLLPKCKTAFQRLMSCCSNPRIFASLLTRHFAVTKQRMDGRMCSELGRVEGFCAVFWSVDHEGKGLEDKLNEKLSEPLRQGPLMWRESASKRISFWSAKTKLTQCLLEPAVPGCGQASSFQVLAALAINCSMKFIQLIKFVFRRNRHTIRFISWDERKLRCKLCVCVCMRNLNQFSFLQEPWEKGQDRKGRRCSAR